MKSAVKSVFFCLLLASSAFSQVNQGGIANAIQSGAQPGSPSSATGVTGDVTNIKNIPELYPGEASDFGTQQVVEQRTHRKWMELDADWQMGYTDNYLLLGHMAGSITSNSGGKSSTTQMQSTWNLAFAPDPFTVEGFPLTPKVGFSQTFWNYGIGTGQNGNFADFDFNTQTFYAESKADLGDNYAVTLGGDWTRITSSYFNPEIYQQYGPKWGGSKLIKLNDYNLISLSLDQQYLFTQVPPAGIGFGTLDRNINDRFNTTFQATYLWSPADRILLSPYIRTTHSLYTHYEIINGSDYDSKDRSDFTNTLGLTASYQLTDNLAFRVYTSYEKRFTTYHDPNDTDSLNVPQYSKFEGGLGGSFNIRF